MYIHLHCTYIHILIRREVSQTALHGCMGVVTLNINTPYVHTYTHTVKSPIVDAPKGGNPLYKRHSWRFRSTYVFLPTVQIRFDSPKEDNRLTKG